MAADQVEVRTKSIGRKKVRVVDLMGVLDIHETQHLERALNSLIAGGSYWIIINFKKCNYISSAGLGVLVGAAGEVRRHQGDLRLGNLPKKIMKIVKLLGFDKILRIYHTEKEALLSFK